MNTENAVQPESGAQEAAETPVADKLGQLDEHSLSDLLKSGFLDEEEAAPALEGKQKDEPEPTEESSGDEVHQEEEGESDQPEADESSLTKGVQKRINKLVAAKKAAQAELDAQKTRLAELQRELEQARSSNSAYQQPQQSDWAESLTTVDQVKKEYDFAINTLMWCESNPDGGTLPLPDGKELELSQEQVRILKTEAIRRKEIELPTRFQFLQNQAQADQEVAADFPWWGKPESEEYQAAQVVLREFPELKRRRADWKHVAGLVVLGMKAYTDLKAKKSSPAAPIKRAPAQPSVSKAPPASASSVNDLAKAKARFVKDSSDQQGIKDLVKAMGFV